MDGYFFIKQEAIDFTKKMERCYVFLTMDQKKFQQEHVIKYWKKWGENKPIIK